ncbi:MAG: M20/M25/M40 family metallo-hydrolase [archaeon YNP-LCB-003-016]|uniref:M20 family metallopeptidase n=1 Tax=Candidatus Culexarchaeum yellowstonense TaxID=2928963 RepID=UPI0026EE1523|nr:M20/M25/M40 family metallo-hydrolase [Candidatus Culexarchaeum yellowstonense]MCR6692114.1 M20/M25/M40 family metallo-hydrolase [Candidatus Culexarchaeum yellowstonense]
MEICKEDLDEIKRRIMEFISVRSIVGEEFEGAKYLTELMRDWGFKPELQKVEENRYNVICRVRLGDVGRRLLLNGHMDTVPPSMDWNVDPFKPFIDDDRLYGLGAIDMKSGLITLLYSLKKFIEENEGGVNGEIIYSAVVDEEGYSKGAKKLVSELDYDAAIIGEPYDGIDSSVVIGETGKILLSIECIGKAAHAFRPWIGVNAIEEASKLILKIVEEGTFEDERFGRIQPTTLKIEGGYKIYNVTLPEKCIFEVNILTKPEQTDEYFINWINELAKKIGLKGGISVKIKEPRYYGYITNENSMIVKAFKKAFEEEYGFKPKIGFKATITDGNIIAMKGAKPLIVYGLRGGNAHMANEYLELKSIEKTCKVYIKTMKNYLKTEEE